MHRGFGKGFPGGPGFGFDGRGIEGRMIERGFGPHWIGLLVMLGLIIILLIAAYFIYKRYRMNNNLALQILNKRFVTGEISEEEYLRKKELLLGKKIKKGRRRENIVESKIEADNYEVVENEAEKSLDEKKDDDTME